MGKGIDRDEYHGLDNTVDIRDGWDIFKGRFLTNLSAYISFSLAVAILLFAIPWLGFLLFLIWIPTTIAHLNLPKDTYPNRLPLYVSRWWPITPALASMIERADGVHFVGNVYRYNPDGSRTLGEEVWNNANQLLTHTLEASGTGAGKTTTITGSLVNTFSNFGWVSVTDGKGEAATARRFLTMCRGWGIEDSARIINYTTSNAPKEFGYKRSHTINLFEDNDKMATTEILVGMINSDKGGGSNKVFQERASLLVDTANEVQYALAEKDASFIKSLGELQKYMNVPVLNGLIRSGSLDNSPRAQQMIANYFNSLQIPQDFDAEKWHTDSMKTSREQHLYAQMYFTKALSTLTINYGYIFNTVYGDLITTDAATNKRFIYQLIPAIDKSDLELKFLTEVVSQLRLNAIKRFLGPRVQGSKREAGDLSHNLSISRSILDEYTFLISPSDPKVVAQARSLSIAFEAYLQSISYTRKRDDEAMTGVESIPGILQAGQTRDEITRKKLVDEAGKRLVPVRSNYSIKYGFLSNKWLNDGSLRLEEKNVFLEADIGSQQRGEAHIVYVGYKDKMTGTPLALRVARFYMGDSALEKLDSVDDIVLPHLLSLPKAVNRNALISQAGEPKMASNIAPDNEDEQGAIPDEQPEEQGEAKQQEDNKAETVKIPSGKGKPHHEDDSIDNFFSSIPQEMLEKDELGRVRYYQKFCNEHMDCFITPDDRNNIPGDILF